MKTHLLKSRYLLLSGLMTLVLIISSCSAERNPKQKLQIVNYPTMKLGFTTQNFQKAFKNNVEDLSGIMRFADSKGFQFIELRDESASISPESCRMLADTAKKYDLEVIYEIQKNPFDTAFMTVFNRGVKNAAMFKPGILRTIVSNPSFDQDPEKIGWNKAELNRLAALVDSCALAAGSKNVRFIVENVNEPFFGDGSSYFGLTDLFAGSSKVGFQLDLSNPYGKTSRKQADPEKVAEYLSSMGDRWVVTHLKTIPAPGGDMQPVLVDSPLSVEKVIGLMGRQKLTYAALELAAVEGADQCFRNHEASIRYLADKGLLKVK
jgi:hypothetical protein